MLIEASTSFFFVENKNINLKKRRLLLLEEDDQQQQNSTQSGEKEADEMANHTLT